jgi:hypothetical protein
MEFDLTKYKLGEDENKDLNNNNNDENEKNNESKNEAVKISIAPEQGSESFDSIIKNIDNMMHLKK